MLQMTLDKLYPMPCPFKIGDRIFNRRFNQIGTIIRIYGEWFDYQLEGTKGVRGVRYSTEKECELYDKEL